jgi:hypothetical protein
VWANVSLSDAYAASAQEAKRGKQKEREEKKHATNVSLGHASAQELVRKEAAAIVAATVLTQDPYSAASAQEAACTHTHTHTHTHSAAQELVSGRKNVGLGMLERFWSAAATAAATVAATVLTQDPYSAAQERDKPTKNIATASLSGPCIHSAAQESEEQKKNNNHTTNASRSDRNRSAQGGEDRDMRERAAEGAAGLPVRTGGGVTLLGGGGRGGRMG